MNSNLKDANKETKDLMSRYYDFRHLCMMEEAEAAFNLIRAAKDALIPIYNAARETDDGFTLNCCILIIEEVSKTLQEVYEKLIAMADDNYYSHIDLFRELDDSDDFP